jgi:flavorubredoxin
MTRITEIAADVFQITTFVPQFDLQISQFLIRDDQPLLYHTGMRSLFPLVRDAVASLIDPTTLRFIAFSHFEPDECGALNEWLKLAPAATPLCSFVGATIFVEDFADRPPRALAADEPLVIGRHTLRIYPTPHFPHGWDASLMFDESTGVLFCSDLFHQMGDVEASTESSVIERCRETLLAYQQGPLADYLPYTHRTKGYIEQLARLHPRACATMHGSTFVGDGGGALIELGGVLEEVLGRA